MWVDSMCAIAVLVAVRTDSPLLLLFIRMECLGDLNTEAVVTVFSSLSARIRLYSWRSSCFCLSVRLQTCSSPPPTSLTGLRPNTVYFNAMLVNLNARIAIREDRSSAPRKPRSNKLCSRCGANNDDGRDEQNRCGGDGESQVSTEPLSFSFTRTDEILGYSANYNVPWHDRERDMEMGVGMGGVREHPERGEEDQVRRDGEENGGGMQGGYGMKEVGRPRGGRSGSGGSSSVGASRDGERDARGVGSHSWGTRLGGRWGRWR